MTKNHFLPFQINTTIFVFVIYFYKMADGGHFGCPKFTFYAFLAISDPYKSFCFEIFYKIAGGAHVRNWLSIAFLAILDRYATF